MNTFDYKAASRKLNEFIHESKMFRDPNYRQMFYIIEQYRSDCQNAFWFGSITLDPKRVERINYPREITKMYGGVFPLMEKLPELPKRDIFDKEWYPQYIQQHPVIIIPELFI